MLLLFMINTQTVLTKKRARPEKQFDMNENLFIIFFSFAYSRVRIDWTDSICKLHLLCSPPSEDLVVRSTAKLMRCAIAR